MEWRHAHLTINKSYTAAAVGGIVGAVMCKNIPMRTILRKK